MRNPTQLIPYITAPPSPTPPPVPRLQRRRIQTLCGPELQLSPVHALQLGHGAQVGPLQLLQLAVVLLVGEEDLAEVEAVCSVASHHERTALRQTVLIAEIRARVLILQLKRSKVM